MEHVDHSALILATAIFGGMVAQVLARHLRIPGIILLLAAGALLGPDVLGWVLPNDLGSGLQTLVGFAVSVILFEGGLCLDLKRLARQVKSIRGLVTWGAVVTAVGGTLLPMWILGWDWRPSVLFGTLVIVTGPTVVTPLLRRMRVKQRVGTVLEAEGVFGDAIGAIVAVVALEVVISPSGSSLLEGVWHVVERIGAGAILGVVAGLVLGWALKIEHWVPEGLENIFTLAAVWALFHGSNSLLPESGIVAVIFAGLTVGNMKIELASELREFKEQLTVLMISVLFVLLAADVRVEQLRDLGWPGLLVVLVLMLVVRPLNVLIGTFGTELNGREKSFIAWMAPRGIVAAAVASLFSQSLDAANIEGGTELRALVFLVIAVTVTVHGLTGGFVAQLLGLRREAHSGIAFLGANALARLTAKVLADGGQKVLLIDSNPEACRLAEAEGLRVIYGNAHAERTLQRADLENKSGCVAMTPNGSLNFAFARRSAKEFRVPNTWVVADPERRRDSQTLLEEIKSRLLFGESRSVQRWQHQIENGSAKLEEWLWQPSEDPVETPLIPLPNNLKSGMLPIAVKGKRTHLIDDRTTWQAGDRLVLLVLTSRNDEVASWLTERGWSKAESAKDS